MFTLRRRPIITEAGNNVTLLDWCMSRRFAPDERGPLPGMAKPYRANPPLVEIKPIDSGSFVAFEMSGEDSAQDPISYSSSGVPEAFS